MTGNEIALLVYVLGYALCFVLFWFVNQWARVYSEYWETPFAISLIYSLLWFLAVPFVAIVATVKWLNSGALSRMWEQQVLFKSKLPKPPCNRKQKGIGNDW